MKHEFDDKNPSHLHRIADLFWQAAQEKKNEEEIGSYFVQLVKPNLNYGRDGQER